MIGKVTGSLAEYYVKQGLRVSDEKPSKGGRSGGGSGHSQNEVQDAVIKALDGRKLAISSLLNFLIISVTAV